MSQYRPDQFINFDGIQKIQQELGREFGRLFEGDWVKPSARYNESGAWLPVADVIETDGEYHFLIELAGVSLNDIDVSVHRGDIRLKGSRNTDSVGAYVQQERASGDFERTLTLPDDADESSLSASMKNGVLSLSVAKDQNKGARSIPVKDVD